MSALDKLRGVLLHQIEDMDGTNPYHTPIDGLILLKAEAQRHPTHIIHKPALCIVAQGQKWTTFGDKRLNYRAGQAMVVSVEIPGASQVIVGNDNSPYLSVVIELDQAIMREVYEALATMPEPSPGDEGGAFVLDLNDQLIDCATRAVDILSQPEAIPLLYSGIMREICYWLLTGTHASALAHMVIGTDRNRKLAQSVQIIRNNFDRALPLNELAEIAGLSPSAFHRHFKALTAMTPLEFQKQVRLLEARRLMISEDMSAEASAFKVGYSSASQFSREYARMFGTPPRRDVTSLQHTAET